MVNLKDIIKDPVKILDFTLDDTLTLLKKANALYARMKEPVVVTAADPADLPAGAEPTLVVLGDTHGDHVSAQSAINEFFFDAEAHAAGALRPRAGHHLLLTGDYVDRTPERLTQGSFVNMMYLLALKIHFPDNITLLRGNHESFEVIPCSPFDLIDELTEHFLSDAGNVLDAVKAVFRQFPLMFRTESGLMAVHGGIFKRMSRLQDLQSLDRNSAEVLLNTTWGEPSEHCAPRMGIGELVNFTHKDFTRFMMGIGANVLLRGHSPDLAGCVIYGSRCLTLVTTRSYLRHAGSRALGVVTVSLNSEIYSTSDLELYLQSRGSWLPAKPVAL